MSTDGEEPLLFNEILGEIFSRCPSLFVIRVVTRINRRARDWAYQHLARGIVYTVPSPSSAYQHLARGIAYALPSPSSDWCRLRWRGAYTSGYVRRNGIDIDSPSVVDLVKDVRGSSSTFELFPANDFYAILSLDMVLALEFEMGWLFDILLGCDAVDLPHRFFGLPIPDRLKRDRGYLSNNDDVVAGLQFHSAYPPQQYIRDLSPHVTFFKDTETTPSLWAVRTADLAAIQEELLRVEWWARRNGIDLTFQ